MEKTGAEFTEGQLQEIDFAASFGVENSECRRHPEWPTVIMNACWNRERRGEPVEPVFRTVEWLEKLPKENGMLYNGLSVITYLLDTYGRGRWPVDPIFKPDGSFDECMFIFNVKCNSLLAKGAVMLYSGRISINDVSNFDLPVVMGEGNPEAVRIVRQLQAWSAAKGELKKDLDMDFAAARTLNMMNPILALDDMNIRGYQIPYALEYAGGSIEILFDLILGRRSGDLCTYLNMRTAKDYLAGDMDHNKAAVSYGASFCHDGLLSGFIDPMNLNMTEATAREMAVVEIEPVAVDWSGLEVMGELDPDQAMRIFEARGFRVVRKVILPEKSGGENLFSLVLYNPVTNDYITCPSCAENDICYGGASLIMHRVDEAVAVGRMFGMCCSSGPHRDQPGRHFEFGWREGLFREYEDSLQFLPETDFDWMKIGFGFGGIPVPRYFKMPVVRVEDLRKKYGASVIFSLTDMDLFYFETLVNRILCLYDGELLKSCSPHYALYREWFLDIGVFDAAGWHCGVNESMSAVYNAVFTWLQVPRPVIQDFMSRAKAYFDLMDSDFYEGCYEVTQTFTNDDPIGVLLAEAYKLPDPHGLPVLLPWLKGPAA